MILYTCTAPQGLPGYLRQGGGRGGRGRTHGRGGFPGEAQHHHPPHHSPHHIHSRVPHHALHHVLLLIPIHLIHHVLCHVLHHVHHHHHVVHQAIQAQREFLRISSLATKPSDGDLNVSFKIRDAKILTNHLQTILKPTAEIIGKIQEFREKGRRCDLFNHLSAIR